MATEAMSDWYAEARRRAVASGRRRRASKESAEWPEFAPPVALSDGPLGDIQAADREIARQTALKARAVARFAASRPATADRAQGEPGAMSAERWAARPACPRAVSEWAPRELVVALSISAQAAEALLSRSLDLVHRLPGTLAALEAGALHPGHLWTMLDKVAPIEDATIRAEVEAELLRWAAGRVVAPAQLNDKALREVTQRDVRAAARRLEKALRERGIHLQPHGVEGMATLTVVATMPEAKALYQALVACAQSLTAADDPRTRGQKMLDCLLDSVLRPGESDLPPVQVLLTVVASIATLAGGDEPGEIDGQVVPAEMVRQLLAALTGAGLHIPTDVDEQQQERPADAGPREAREAGAGPREAREAGAGPREAREAGAGPNAERPAGAGPNAERPADALRWEEREQRELESWWAEMERRVLAGELVDPDPEPCPPSTDDLGHLPLDSDLWLDDGWTESPEGFWSALDDRPAPDAEAHEPWPADELHAPRPADEAPEPRPADEAHRPWPADDPAQSASAVPGEQRPPDGSLMSRRTTPG